MPKIDLNKKHFNNRYILECLTDNGQLFGKSFNDFSDAMSQLEVWHNKGSKVSFYVHVFSVNPEEE